jgi:hypothetical protein
MPRNGSRNTLTNIKHSLSRAAEKDLSRQPTILKLILKSPMTKIATTVVIILGISFFSTHQATDEKEQTGIAEVKKSPVEMMTAISLERAFRRGGIEVVEEQCKQVFKSIATRPASSSIKQILAEFNGNSKSSERTRP